MADPHSPPPAQVSALGIPLRVLIPNLITLLVLASGLTAIRFAVEGRLEHAVLAIGAAAVLDGLDGRVARLLKGSSQFGAELDSLADFISFGCGPALVLYFWSLNELSTLGWLAAISLAFSAALRLARFNVMATDTTRPEWTKGFFTGVPAPAGALLALLPLNLYISGVPRFTGHAALVAIYSVCVAALMVSRLPTFSGKGKGERIPRNIVIPVVMVVMVVFVLLFSHPFPTISAITIGYLALLPLGFARYKALRAAHAGEDRPGQDGPDAA
jgi:CDP-diacylglycerol--serine O-phosphatidyltransferase